MKILVFSDSHRYNTNMEQVIHNLGQSISHVLHLGDCSDDAEKLSRTFPELGFDWVSGNSEYSKAPSERIITLGGKKILMAHGHKHGVKHGYNRILYAALEKEVDACFFGHTHQPVVFYERGILFLNPGSISLPRGVGFPSYGVADISENGIEGRTVDYVSR